MYTLSRLVAVVLTFCALATSSARAHGEGSTIVLKPTAEIEGATYTLGDIADIQGAHKALRERLSALVIGKAPRMGYSAQVRREVIEEQVARLAPQARARLLWSGASSVNVRGRGQRIDANAVVDAAALEVFRVFGEKYKPLQLRPVGDIEDTFVPHGEVRLQPRLAPGEAIAKRVCVWVNVHLDGKPYRRLPVWFDAKAVRPVLVSKYARQPGEGLRKSDFSIQPVDVTAYASPPLGSEEADLDKLRLRQGVESGGPVLRSQVEERPDVARHESVTVSVAQGSIVIEITGIALADARVGEMVKIKNPHSNETFTAKVVADRAVLIDGR